MTYKLSINKDSSELIFPEVIHLYEPPFLYVIGKDKDGQAYSLNLFEPESRINMNTELYEKTKERITNLNCDDTLICWREETTNKKVWQCEQGN